MYICVHIYIYIYICTYVFVYIYIYVYTCLPQGTSERLPAEDPYETSLLCGKTIFRGYQQKTDRTDKTIVTKTTSKNHIIDPTLITALGGVTSNSHKTTNH